jgi:hypothetical protein
MLFSAALIGGAFVLANSATDPPIAEASEESALLAAVATRDSDSDGLSDWEEALYGTSPDKADSRELGMTDGEAVAKGLIVPQAIADVPVSSTASGDIVSPDLPPAAAEGTLTAAFSRNIFTRYLDALQASEGELSDTDLADIANQALGELGASITAAPPFKRAQDLTVQGSGREAMKAFAAAADAVMRANTTTASKSEVFYLADHLQNGDAKALEHIRSLAKLYRGTAAGLAALPVPKELAGDSLALVNAFARMSEATNDFALVDDDPLVTMLALNQYPNAVLALGNAFIKIMNDYRDAGITFTPGEKGGAFVNIIENIAAEQQAHKATAP